MFVAIWDSGYHIYALVSIAASAYSVIQTYFDRVVATWVDGQLRIRGVARVNPPFELEVQDRAILIRKDDETHEIDCRYCARSDVERFAARLEEVRGG